MFKLLRIKKAMLALAVVPAASIIALGTAPASAVPSVDPDILSTNCVPGYVCFFADINFLPRGHADDVLDYSVMHADWSQQPDPAHVCGGIITHTWNDCASSVINRLPHAMCVYSNAGFSGLSLKIRAGESISDLRTVGMNDKISSNRSADSHGNC